MTEKRFTCENDYHKGFILKDNLTDDVLEEEGIGGYDNACECLNTIYEENTQLRELLDIGRTNAKSILDVLNDQEQRLNALHEEREIYKRLFNEMAYYFRDNVKSLNDLDHKDFEALQGLANGEYFDEEVMAWCKVRLEDLE